jgi:hypothetical protein
VCGKRKDRGRRIMISSGDRVVETKEGFDDVVVIFLVMVCITFCHRLIIHVVQRLIRI